ncbi:hypothetical protein A0H81_03021 [Grifola frondosa]|uniref:Uncharacterized protein n=1 Tax=Grifola frondosa TaxID=5627 RepID=A0A1C7MI06_GRIFR|nr:hypothetical protein A0H81_03021 [Grifola frondosa]
MPLIAHGTVCAAVLADSAPFYNIWWALTYAVITCLDSLRAPKQNNPHSHERAAEYRSFIQLRLLHTKYLLLRIYYIDMPSTISLPASLFAAHTSAVTISRAKFLYLIFGMLDHL